MESRCPKCGQPLMLGRCGLCGWKAPVETPAQPAETSATAATTATPATPATATTATTPAAPRPAAPPPAAPSPARMPQVDEHRLAPLTVGLIVALVVVGMIALYGMVSLSGLRSDISGLRDDQSSASNRLTGIEGELKTQSDAQSELRAQLDAQRAADPVVIASKVQPSVFTIGSEYGLGSGWVVKSDGTTSLLVTNWHVVADVLAAGRSDVLVYHDNDTKLTGTVIGSSEAADLALISVLGQLPALKMSNQKVAAGQTVLVVGSPLGLGGSVTTGSVSALRDEVIQFSAPVSPGNSGGPVINLSGEVVGVTEAKYFGIGVEGIGIAIPVARVCSEFRIC